jgi:small subunit ribosomal protein S8
MRLNETATKEREENRQRKQALQEMRPTRTRNKKLWINALPSVLQRSSKVPRVSQIFVRTIKMTLLDPLADALSTMVETEKRRKRECIVWPASKLMGQVLRVMQKNGYVGEFEFIDDGRSGKFRIQLLGRINKCGVVKPRYSVKLDQLEFWEKRYLPSRDLGTLVLTTATGVISNKEAKEKRTSGKLIAYVY